MNFTYRMNTTNFLPITISDFFNQILLLVKMLRAGQEPATTALWTAPIATLGILA